MKQILRHSSLLQVPPSPQFPLPVHLFCLFSSSQLRHSPTTISLETDNVASLPASIKISVIPPYSTETILYVEVLHPPAGICILYLFLFLQLFFHSFFSVLLFRLFVWFVWFVWFVCCLFGLFFFFFFDETEIPLPVQQADFNP